jgi:hypothetical protein
MLNLLLDDRSGGIQGLKAASTAKKRKRFLRFMDELDRFWPRFGEQYRLAFGYRRDRDDGSGL